MCQQKRARLAGKLRTKLTATSESLCGWSGFRSTSRKMAPDSQELGTQRLEEFNDWPDRQPDSGQIGHLLEVDLAEQDLISGVITEEEEEQRPCPVQPA